MDTRPITTDFVDIVLASILHNIELVILCSLICWIKVVYHRIFKNPFKLSVISIIWLCVIVKIIEKVMYILYLPVPTSILAAYSFLPLIFVYSGLTVFLLICISCILIPEIGVLIGVSMDHLHTVEKICIVLFWIVMYIVAISAYYAIQLYSITTYMFLWTAMYSITRI